MKTLSKTSVSALFNRGKILLLMGAGMMLNLVFSIVALAQNAGAGTAALNAANTEVRAFFAPAILILYAVAAIIGLIGIIKVYQKFASGDQDATRLAAGWFGACIFLVIAATALSAFFGVA